jgi:ParB/RepB/Spo0J family partition protein
MTVIQQVPVAQILASENNPRTVFDEQGLEELSASVRIDGILDPIRGVREGDYFRIESGHRRYQAALAAGLESVPLIEVEQDSTDEAVRALVTNVQREDLNPVDEAQAYRYLIAEHGLTALGAAQRVGVSPSRVTQRLELLEFDETIDGLFASRKQTPNTRTSLKAIARVSTKLAHAVAKLSVSKGWDNALAKQPGLLALEVAKDKKGVYALPGSYLLGEDFKLTKEVQPELALLFPSGYEPTQRVRFTEQDADAAKAAGVGYQGKGSDYVIVDDAAWIEAQVIVTLQARAKEIEAQRVEQAKRMIKDGQVKPETTVTEAEKAKERNRAERQAHLDAREVAHAANMDLGKVILTELAKIDVGSMPMPVAQTLSRALVGGNRGGLFMGGLRYCLPQYVKTEEVQRKKDGPKTTKRVYVESVVEGSRLCKEWLDGATSPAELIGRTMAVLVAARYADQGVVPQSQRRPMEIPRGAEDAPTLSALNEYAKVLVPKVLTSNEKPSERFVRDAVAKLG